MMRKVDYNALLENVNAMIATLEFDSSRSAGKTKVNSNTLVDLYSLKDRYEGFVKPEVKEEPVKKVTKKVATKKEV